MVFHPGYKRDRHLSAAIATAFAALILSALPVFAQGPGTALHFDGVDDRVNCGSSTSLEISPNLSIEVWVKTTQSGATKQIVGKGKATGFSYMLALDALRPSVYLGGTSSAAWIIAPTAIPSGRWTHIALTYNGSQVGSQVKIYINGVLDRQVPVSGGINKNPGQPVWIGNRSDLAGCGFQGELDELRIWSKALSATEIRAAMCRKLAGSESNLAAYWRSDEGAGTTVADLSANSNDGTLGIVPLNPAWVRSGAPLGDISTYSYPTGSSLSLSHPDGDTLSADTFAGSPSGVHIYRVDGAPNPNTPPLPYKDLDPLRYWGVFLAGGTSPSSRVVYNYWGHPGLGDESLLRLADRPDASSPAWADAGALPDTGAHELVKAAGTSCEVVLGSTGDLCMEILLLGEKIGADALFYWTPDCVATTYQVFRTASKTDIINRWAQVTPWSTVSDTLVVDLVPPEDLVFYEVFPINPNILRLDWTGETSPLCNGLPCDRVGGGSNGFEADGFCPKRGETDPMVYPWADSSANLVISGDPGEFRVKLTCSDCPGGPADIAVMDLLVDRNDDGDFTDPGEVLALQEVDPTDLDLADGKLYRVELGGASALFARDAAGHTRWAMADGSGTVSYAFRASTATVAAGGPASGLSELTLLNSARELIDDLGKPVVAAGAGSYGTDWLTARTYFEEAESRSWGVVVGGPAPRTVSPYNITGNVNLGFDAELDGDWHDALMASSIAESAYTLRHYMALFQTPATKLYRDTMLDWVAFSQEQVDRMGYLQQFAPSETADPLDRVWRFHFPKFSMYLEDGGSPFAAGAAVQGGDVPGLGSSGVLSPLNPLGTLSGPLFLARGLGEAPIARGEAAKPIYTFEASEWDRADACLLKALFHSIHGAASLVRVYEDPGLGRAITAGDLDAIEVWLRPEEDAKAHAECKTKPCPPLNGLDDDGDGLIDDLGYTARVLQEFPGVGIYTQDDVNGLSLISVAADATSAVGALRQGMRLVLLERDRQTQYWGADDWPDATLVYGDGGDHPPTFTDEKSYDGFQIDGSPCPGAPAPCADGLPDMVWLNDFVPVGWCPEDPLHDPPIPPPPLASTPLTIQGGLGDDLQWWIDEFVKAYNKAAGMNYDAACYPQGWGYTAFVTDWGYTLEKALADTTPHYTINLRDDVEKALQDNDINPADLGPDFQRVLVFLESIDIRQFVENPENVRGYAPYFCGTYGPPGHTAGCEGNRENYSINGFYGDWDEPTDPVVPKKFWTIEPFSTFNQDASGILLPPCDPAHLGTDSSCIQRSWDDLNHNGKFDLFEPVLMANASTPLRYIDLNGDGQWNGWADRDHKKVLYAGEGADPGKGLYNAIYIYFQDPTFGGRLAGMTNEGLNNMLGVVAGWADGLLEYPSKNHHPVNYHMVQEAPSAPGANLRLHITATDPDGDTLHYKLVLPSLWSGAEVLIDGNASGVYELAVPPGTWGLIGLVYDNVNNLSDLAATYLVVTVP
jgi:hypothetical protein